MPLKRRALLGGAALAAAGACSRSEPPPASAPPSPWAFRPAPDEFRADALLDLRSLNEAVAGETGFIRVGANGDFVRGDGTPIRFWAVNTDVARRPFAAAPLGPRSAPDLARHARFLAKRGVNMVRLHRQLGPAIDAHPDAAFDDIDEVERDSIWRTVAAMRREGIYTTISPYWAAMLKLSSAWGFAGGAQQPAFGLLFFDEMLQNAYKSWLRKLFAERNPYTGVSLADDASVALIQLQNEDSLLFWTVDGIQDAQREKLEARFGTFLTRKYGSLAAAAQAWNGDRAPRDAPQAGRIALLPLWELTRGPAGSGSAGGPMAALRAGIDWVRRGPGHETRRADQAEFYARTMFDFNRATVKFLREEVGAKQLINAGNWKTANNARLNDLERWSYTAAEVDAVNVYTGGLHEGGSSGWAIVAGDRFTSESVLLDPRALPVNLRQTAGRPMLVTEGGWVLPNAYAAEGPFLIAAYSSLNGIDGYCWFSTTDEAWSPPQSANGYAPSQQKWTFATPDVLGTFPAAALAYRRGDLRQGLPVLVERRAAGDLWRRKAPLVAEETSFDPNRDATRPVRTGHDALAVPPEAFLVGPVQVSFEVTTSSAEIRSDELSKALAEPGVIRANTGQIAFDAAQGFCTIDSPLTQGVAAHFARGPTHQLSDVRFTSRNRYGAAMAVSLDGLPLRSSRRILIQYGTQSRPTGWKEVPTTIARAGQAPVPGYVLESFGAAPWQVVRAQLEVSVRNPGLTSGTVLDMNGMAVATLALKRSATQVEFSFPESAMYVVLR
ncbi:MAG TPA: hypothetical protein VJO99_20325 [Burkholderiaceae bacterium]|nr:hypothetical protein [Burkholderiaceae bacterium]